MPVFQELDFLNRIRTQVCIFHYYYYILKQKVCDERKENGFNVFVSKSGGNLPQITHYAYDTQTSRLSRELFACHGTTA